MFLPVQFDSSRRFYGVWHTTVKTYGKSLGALFTCDGLVMFVATPTRACASTTGPWRSHRGFNQALALDTESEVHGTATGTRTVRENANISMGRSRRPYANGDYYVEPSSQFYKFAPGNRDTETKAWTVKRRGAQPHSEGTVLGAARTTSPAWLLLGGSCCVTSLPMLQNNIVFLPTRLSLLHSKPATKEFITNFFLV